MVATEPFLATINKKAMKKKILNHPWNNTYKLQWSLVLDLEITRSEVSADITKAYQYSVAGWVEEVMLWHLTTKMLRHLWPGK